jgi:hypothetical protein
MRWPAASAGGTPAQPFGMIFTERLRVVARS